ncbi:hypothetical protein [Kocuria sp. ZOR0020]|nr:hypothetical protein [Kocuria sp. ZOR0020]
MGGTERCGVLISTLHTSSVVQVTESLNVWNTLQAGKPALNPAKSVF